MPDLVSRWKTSEGEHLAREVLERLRRGARLDGLQLGEHQGRIDLRGMTVPTTAPRQTSTTSGWVLQHLSGQVVFDGIRLVGLDFSQGFLQSMRFFRSALVDCRFDGAACQDWRLWATDLSNTSFDRTDLRKAVLGAWHEGRGNLFQHVDFTKANLRSIVCPAATFEDCDFSGAQLAKVDFQSSSFIRCKFAGLLSEVIFDDHGYKTGKPDPNPMLEVDFTEAELRMVEFRRLSLDRVAFPKDDHHLVVDHYRCVLERAVEELKALPDWGGLRADMEHRLKWVGPNQERGMFNLRDMAEAGGTREADFARDLLLRLEHECS
jgi:uncharacterized protein YjbI with pentapeptide repeats